MTHKIALASISFPLLALIALAVGSAAAAPQVMTAVAGASLSYYQAKPEELEPAVRDIAAHAQLLWIGIPGWDKDCLKFAGEIERVQQLIDLAHKHGLEAAFGLHWSSLLPKEKELPNCPFAGETLNPEDGSFVKVGRWDFGSESSRQEFEARLRKLFALVDRPVEMFYQDEIIVGKPGKNFWYQPISTYWTSPTYSAQSLDSFRAYLKVQDYPGAAEAKFPVTTTAVEPGARANEGLPAVSLTEANRTRLQEDNDWPNSLLWKHWYTWREDLYARWLDTATTVATEACASNPHWRGCCYIMPVHWAKSGLGQNLDKIAALKHMDIICSGYMSGTKFQPFREAANRAGKQWGATLETCHYGEQEGIKPERIKEVFQAAVEAGAAIINVYAGANFRTDRRKPTKNGLYYMPDQVRAWDESVRWLKNRPHTAK